MSTKTADQLRAELQAQRIKLEKEAQLREQEKLRIAQALRDLTFLGVSTRQLLDKGVLASDLQQLYSQNKLPFPNITERAPDTASPKLKPQKSGWTSEWVAPDRKELLYKNKNKFGSDRWSKNLSIMSDSDSDADMPVAAPQSSSTSSIGELMKEKQLAMTDLSNQRNRLAQLNEERRKYENEIKQQRELVLATQQQQNAIEGKILELRQRKEVLNATLRKKRRLSQSGAPPEKQIGSDEVSVEVPETEQESIQEPDYSPDSAEMKQVESISNPDTASEIEAEQAESIPNPDTAHKIEAEQAESIQDPDTFYEIAEANQVESIEDPKRNTAHNSPEVQHDLDSEMTVSSTSHASSYCSPLSVFNRYRLEDLFLRGDGSRAYSATFNSLFALNREADLFFCSKENCNCSDVHFSNFEPPQQQVLSYILKNYVDHDTRKAFTEKLKSYGNIDSAESIQLLTQVRKELGVSMRI